MVRELPTDGVTLLVYGAAAGFWFGVLPFVISDALPGPAGGFVIAVLVGVSLIWAELTNRTSDC